VIVEKEVFYNAPNGETVHHNVFRRFLTAATGDVVDLSSGTATKTYQYAVEGGWNASETYIIAWVSDPTTKEIYNSGTRFDPDFVSAVNPVQPLSALALYPNPATTEVNITLPADVPAADVQVFDQLGRLVHSISAAAGPIVNVPAGDLSPGRYIVKLLSGEKQYAGSFEIVR
jgi:Secretion system C-terminal sorting domain